MLRAEVFLNGKHIETIQLIHHATGEKPDGRTRQLFFIEKPLMIPGVSVEYCEGDDYLKLLEQACKVIAESR